MTEVEIKQAYYELIQISLNNFKGVEIDKAPMPVRLAIEKLIEYGKKDSTVQSEGIADLSISYFEVKDFPGEVKLLLNPYRNLRW